MMTRRIWISFRANGIGEGMLHDGVLEPGTRWQRWDHEGVLFNDTFY